MSTPARRLTKVPPSTNGQPSSRAPLNARTATITTATIEIRTMTVNDRQVTQALFRQLQERWCFDAKGQATGDLWGTVNYCPGKQCGSAEWEWGSQGHLHVVWSDGTDLYRCAVGIPPGRPAKVEAVTTRVNAERAEEKAKHEKRLAHWQKRVAETLAKHNALPDDAEQHTVEASERSLKYERQARETEMTAEAESKRVAARTIQQARDEMAYYERSVVEWNTVTTLPQLFIAV